MYNVSFVSGRGMPERGISKEKWEVNDRHKKIKALKKIQKRGVHSFSMVSFVII